MKRLLLTTTAVFGLIAGIAAATPFTDQVVSGLQAQGFDHIEIVQGATQLKVEAIRGTSTVEIIYDLATGAILKQETGTVGSGADTTPGVEIGSDDGDFVNGSDDDSGNDDISDDSNDDNGSDDDNSDDSSSDESNDDSDDSSDDSSDDDSSHDSGDDHGSDGNGGGDNSNDE